MTLSTYWYCKSISAYFRGYKTISSIGIHVDTCTSNICTIRYWSTISTIWSNIISCHITSNWNIYCTRIIIINDIRTWQHIYMKCCIITYWWSWTCTCSINNIHWSTITSSWCKCICTITIKLDCAFCWHWSRVTCHR